MSLESGRANILNVSRQQLVDWLAERGIAAYRAGQILKWIHRRQKDDFAEMSDIAKEVRALLPQHFRIPRLEIRALQTSTDGTRKYLFGLEDGETIESVLIPERDHFTLCVSSQVGCAQNCRFCLTAKSKLRRNLTCGEIIAQVRDIKHGLAHAHEHEVAQLLRRGEPVLDVADLGNDLAA
ncbi:MAG TPA: 23S rRNA (adenine(2503)-C(2))-methyltransferase RlmN, partial [Desulfobacterales bacterium]|nr:23S rRNA (adenine(2503)-C(2))-methyltransferase RlmN [Desulfobacterales bacterium]